MIVHETDIPQITVEYTIPRVPLRSYHDNRSCRITTQEQKLQQHKKRDCIYIYFIPYVQNFPKKRFRWNMAMLLYTIFAVIFTLDKPDLKFFKRPSI